MSVRKVHAKITVDDREALASSRKVKGEMDAIEREAKQAQAAVTSARAGGGGLQGRFSGLLARAKNRGIEFRDDGMMLGDKFQLGRGGVSVTDSFKKGQGGGAGAGLMRGAFGAMVIGNVTGAGLEKIADIRDFIRENQHMTYGQIVESVAAGASQTIFEVTGAKSILRGTMRLAGEDAEVFDMAYKAAWGDTSEIDTAISEAGARIRQNREAIERKNEADERRKEAAEAALRKIDERLEQQLAGLKTKVFRPKNIRLGRDQNNRVQRLYRENMERHAKKQASAAAVPHQQIRDGEGR